MRKNTGLFEAFILTYNRSNFLATSLLSLLEQTYKDFPITILDNASTDDTVQCVRNIQKKYPNRDIRIKTAKTNTGTTGNFKRAQKLASAKYVILFHDDDILHPTYIETCLKLIKKHPHVHLVGCDCNATSTPETTPWHRFSGQYYLFNRKQFTHYLLAYKSIAYPAVIYSTKELKKISLQADKYGKTADRVLIIDAVSSGSAIVFKDKYLKYRNHPGQDTHAHSTGPYEPEILALMKKYQKEAASNSKVWKLAYNIFILEKMKSNWRWALKKQMTFEQFQKNCVKAGIINKIAGKKQCKMIHYFSKIYRIFLFKRFRRHV